MSEKRIHIANSLYRESCQNISVQTVRDLPTRGPLANLPAKYVGEISLSRRSLAGEKWFTAFFPERMKEKGRGFQVIGPITRKFMDALPGEGSSQNW